MTTVKIIQDTDPMSPREFDNIGIMVCWHRRYDLGDIQPKQTPEEWNNAIPKGSVVLPLYLYDHSGITMRTSKFSCEWDSGQVGVIIATPEKIRECYQIKRITKKTRERVVACLEQEVKTYDQYLRGDVWGFVVENNGEHEDSCCGFFGDKLSETGILENLSPKLHASAYEAWEKRA